MLRIRSLVSFTVLFASIALQAGAQVDWRGFMEYAVAARVSDAAEGDFVLHEGRVQLAGDRYGDRSGAHFAIDIIGDRQSAEERIEIREAYARIDLLDGKAELRAGRQPATWGTGDLLFINDLFPKDYVSFFAGRSDEYLKLPVDALRLGVYPGSVSFDVLWIPSFTPNRIPSDERFVLDEGLGLLPVDSPGGSLENSEFALRVGVPRGAWKLEGYAYRGFWKNPMGVRIDELSNIPETLFHPELAAFGGSLRGTLRGGVVWAEAGFYDSMDDTGGDDPLIPNSQSLAFAGYERSWWSDGTVGTQAQWTRIQDSDEDDRWLLTLRFTQLLAAQTVRAALFAFWSPSDADNHLRVTLGYDLEDGVNVTVGAHVFNGDSSTDFGRVAENDLLFGRLRVSF
jgi:hypothetical protein